MHRTARGLTAALAAAAIAVLGGAVSALPAAAAAVCPTVAADGSLDRGPYSGVDWSGCDLSGANLAGADLRMANLSSATLTGANLTGAQLDYVNLTRASAANSNFTGATGYRGTYEYATLTGATFTRATLTFSDLDNAYLDGAQFTDADLSGAHLWSSTMRAAQIRTSSFRGAYTDMLSLTGATIDVSNFSSAKLGMVMLNGATITNSNFDGTVGVGIVSWRDTVTASGNTWVGATCADGKASTAHLGGDCLRDPDVSAPAAYYPTIVGPGTGVDHWYTGPITINWNWYDESGLTSSCTPSTVMPAVTGTVTASCTDTAGNVGTASYTAQFDLTAPSLSATVSAAPNGTNGWYRTTPTIRYTCTDSGSGVARCPATTTATQGSRTYTVTAADKAGNTTTNATALKLDSVRPSVAASVTTLNSYGAQTPKCVATDLTSGVSTCRVTTTASSNPNYRYATATATDKAGNTATSAKVLYRSTTVAAFKSVPSTVTHGARFSVYVTSKNARGTLINLTGVRALSPVKVTSTGVGPANTTLSTYATRTATGTYRVTFTAPSTRGYYRYAIRVGNATVTKVIRVA